MRRSLIYHPLASFAVQPQGAAPYVCLAPDSEMRMMPMDGRRPVLLSFGSYPGRLVPIQVVRVLDCLVR